MKTNIKSIITVALMLVVMLSLCGCSDNWEAPYASLQDENYNIAVRFDVNGGLFAGTKDVSVVDVFSQNNGITTADGKLGYYLLTPEDPIREEGAFSASKNGYFLAGWYQERNLRVDENGQPLDEFGVPTSESGRPQGYTYSGKWDFENDVVKVDPNGTYSADEPVMTLYAAWVPYIHYDFYALDPISGEASYLETVKTIELKVPQWNERTGKLDLKDFPKREGFTFDGVYSDAEQKNPIVDPIDGNHYVDYETGTLSTESVRLYTTWLDGEWFKIFTADQFYSNARLDGNYMIMNDLDFADAVWPPVLIKGKFTGTIQGNGHTISNITAVQADNAQIYGGLFGSIENGSVISDLTFENVTFTIEAGSRMQGAAFGLLTGSLSNEAVLSNIFISGKLLISEKCYPQSDYTIGLLCGFGNNDNIRYTIDCGIAEDSSDLITVNVQEDGSVIVNFVNP